MSQANAKQFTIICSNHTNLSWKVCSDQAYIPCKEEYNIPPDVKYVFNYNADSIEHVNLYAVLDGNKIVPLQPNKLKYDGRNYYFDVYLDTPTKSPSDVVREFFKTFKDKKLEVLLREYFSDSISEFEKLPPDKKVYINKVWTGIRSNLDKIEIMKEEINDDKATVYCKVYLKDGRAYEGEDVLVRKDNNWKLRHRKFSINEELLPKNFKLN
ncbi:MAG: DUF4878 domain-containing protein [Candidatus Woesearchaeota archaeon]|nr:DUF4878 domain-containing protein [Candidatus Woesearchaeota archaeon]